MEKSSVKDLDCRKKERAMPFKFNFIFIAGFCILILGVGLILIWWPEVVNLFKGATGIILALTGLIVLYTVKR